MHGKSDSLENFRSHFLCHTELGEVEWLSSEAVNVHLLQSSRYDSGDSSAIRASGFPVKWEMRTFHRSSESIKKKKRKRPDYLLKNFIRHKSYLTRIFCIFEACSRFCQVREGRFEPSCLFSGVRLFSPHSGRICRFSLWRAREARKNGPASLPCPLFGPAPLGNPGEKRIRRTVSKPPGSS